MYGINTKINWGIEYKDIFQMKKKCWIGERQWIDYVV